MTGSPPEALSRRRVSFPVPWYAAEMKIHPSPGRVNLNELPDFEMAATSSSSETRLFRFVSPENTTVPSPRADAQAQVDSRIAKIRVAFTVDSSRGRDELAHRFASLQYVHRPFGEVGN